MFAVEPNAVASEIAKAVESIYKVHVVNTNVINRVSKAKNSRKLLLH